jgi:hypothetical protein
VNLCSLLAPDVQAGDQIMFVRGFCTDSPVEWAEVVDTRQGAGAIFYALADGRVLWCGRASSFVVIRKDTP